jgi:hypothetical protein
MGEGPSFLSGAVAVEPGSEHHQRSSSGKLPVFDSLQAIEICGNGEFASMEVSQPNTDSSTGAVQGHEPIQAQGFQDAFIRILRMIFTTPGGWWLICICMAASLAWPARHQHVAVDAVSYLDLGREVSSGDLTALANSYWSAAYPALLGAGFFLLRPSPANEVAVVQLVDFFIFILTLGAFTLFFRNWSRSIPEYEQASTTDKGLFTLFAFACFLWFGLYSLRVTLTTPDMLVAAQVLFVAAMGCRVSRPDAGLKHFVGLGTLLGLGIYVKAALFPLAFAFIALLFISRARNSGIPRRKQLAYLAAITAMCVAVAIPLIVFMSVQAGRFTTGDTGKLAYLWSVDEFKPNAVGWTGGTPPQYGTPIHPPRKLMDDPKVLEFATPIPGTYPLWHSPGYWYAGAKPVFILRKQFAAISRSLDEYRQIVIRAIGFVGGALLLFVLSLFNSKKARPWRMSLWLVAWPLVGCAMYALVLTFERYVAAFVLLLCLEVYGALAFRVERRFAIGVCAVALLVAMAPLALLVGKSLAATVRQVRHPVEEDYVITANNLQQMGLQPGDKVAYVGFAASCYSAQYDHLRVVSQIVNADDFWRLNPADAKGVEDRVASIGVKAVVTTNRPAGNQEPGWTEVGHVDGNSISVLLLLASSSPSH